MPVSAVAFDLDYTLAVPERDRQTLLDEATAAVGAPRLSRETYLDAHRRNLTNETREAIFADLLDENDPSPAALADAYREAIGDALVPVDGVETLVADLQESYRVGLLTDGPVRAQRSKLDALGWTELFDVVVVTGSLDAGKPDERAFRTVTDELSTRADETVYVGDHADIDIVGAHDAGLRTVHVTDDDPIAEADGSVERDALAAQLPGIVDSL
ncbi:HAD family hydrolase [Halococcus thailandensis]|uniref:HAD-superfamily hydrolase, subfamily IA, variant 3 n=1 Tax=Halococcus thailandensis JCM 13552 TaxID=1227457 RepID=M0N3F4_9EURY|nr:HAD family hydrolase [Halococcus thailandensis]EMA52053.1 HAD-superfamily hydrolase, subfamily IA, variant 3 [Halococcus thailandensis JCM 13552]